ncbi:hypothetical protein [Metabacillus litoralis]|uniref:hypothetical protein n=1 Tax=Metabacillus litoralis TaxID=152268 RepID=UPI00144838DF|nr:hypothetical protein [Metabacillus litoralis]
MNRFEDLPKSIKKTIRYLYQDAPLERLIEIQKMLNNVIEKRLQESKMKTKIDV